ncbi:MAG: patatin-like phospholipase family protein [Rhodospirillales bacterium]|nr:patatin-like phospholipase family protein [Rhodospirillales bacterium]
MTMRMPRARTFEVGLVMAGAVSAGAYTAGVVDFLLQSLDAWEQAKQTRAVGIPDHTVQIRAAAGSSAGGIVSALTAMIPFTGHHPITDLAAARSAASPANAERNLLYRCWVRDIDIRSLLKTSDLDAAAGGVSSLLNGRAVAAVADAAVANVRAAIAGGSRRCAPAYFANPLQLYLCLTNMRGLPYVIEMVTAGGVRGHRVTTHADYAQFAVHGAGAGAAEPLYPGVVAVNWPGTAGIESIDGWGRLRDAALATSAFPGGLPARSFANTAAFYQARPWARPADVSADEAGPVINPDVVCAPGLPYEFWCVDGGLINNEPVEYARIALAGGRNVHNARDARQSDRAVLMIDPLPEDEGCVDPGCGAAPDIVEALFSMFATLRRQARFKPQEVMLAMHEDVHSRFLIAPLRPDKLPSQTDLASVGLSGFVGFVNEQLRMHDFQLGRRNCQKFLRDHFVVHIENPIVAPWVEQGRAAGLDLSDYHPRRDAAGGGGELDDDFVQLIPLFGDARKPVALRPWPRLDPGEVSPILDMIDRRVGKIMPEFVHSLLKRIGIDDHCFANRVVGMIAGRVIRDRLLATAGTAIQADLLARGLLDR